MPWPSRRVLDLLGIELPILQAPMAGASGSAMAIAVAQAGGLGSLPAAMLSAEQFRREMDLIRSATSRPIHVNFFAHRAPERDEALAEAWRQRLATYYEELGLDSSAPLPAANRRPFDDEACELVEQYRPEIVSFHFGLPESRLLARVRATGAKILCSATNVEEARHVESEGCDAVIAQGWEAGGHRGMFLTSNVATQVGTFALIPQVASAVRLPVIAAGGISDGRGIAAAFALGADAVQIGTAYLFCPEATLTEVHRAALRRAWDTQTVITNVFSGRPARGIENRLIREVGPLSGAALAFPLASAAVAPLRRHSETAGSEDFAQMWSGQAAALGREMPAGELTKLLAEEARSRLAALSPTAARRT